MPTLPEISSLSSLPILSQLQALDTLFEPSESLHALIIPILEEDRFTSYNGLVDAVEGRLRGLAGDKDADVNTLYNILGSHPRLGENAAAAATSESADSQKPHLSDLSKLEQANLVSASASVSQAQEEARKLMELNREYEERFPGLRYVVFVNGRGRDVIMQDMRRRIDRGDINLEIDETIQAMCDIAKDRARKLQSE